PGLLLPRTRKRRLKRRRLAASKPCPLVQQSTASKNYRVDSISNPQASSRASGMYFEFLFRRAHSRSLVERIYWSGVSLTSFTTCSNDVTVGTTGPIGSGLPQFGFPRRFAISFKFPLYLVWTRQTQQLRSLAAIKTWSKTPLLSF